MQRCHAGLCKCSVIMQVAPAGAATAAARPIDTSPTPKLPKTVVHKTLPRTNTRLSCLYKGSAAPCNNPRGRNRRLRTYCSGGGGRSAAAAAAHRGERQYPPQPTVHGQSHSSNSCMSSSNSCMREQFSISLQNWHRPLCNYPTATTPSFAPVVDMGMLYT